MRTMPCWFSSGKRYDEMAINWTGSVFGMIAAMETATEPSQKALTVSEFIQYVVDQLKQKQARRRLWKGQF